MVNNAADTENLLTATENGAVTLYYDNSPKLATTSTGVDVTGAITADGLTVNSSEVLFDNTGGDFTLKLNTNAVGDKNEIIMGDTSTPLVKFGVGGTANDIITGSDGQDFNIGTAGGGRAINFSTDNFSSVEMKLDSGNLLVGKTSTAIENVGVSLFATGRVISTADGDDVAVLNRKTSEGDIAVFKKDGSTVGSIGTANADLHIDGVSGHSGIRFQAGSLLPRKNGSDTNNTIDLGYDDGSAIHRFKNLYLAGNAYIDTTDAILTVNSTSSGSGVAWIKFADQGTSKWGIGLSKNSGNSGADFSIFEDASSGNPRFTVKDGGAVGINNNSPQRYLHIKGPDGGSGLVEGNSRTTLFLDNAGANYVNIASGNTANGAIFFSDPDANNAGAVLYQHSTNSMFLRAAQGVDKVKLSGQSNVSYTSDGLFNSNARPSYLKGTGSGSGLLLGYRDNGSGLYSQAMALAYDAIDGLGNTSYVDGFIMRDEGNGSDHLRISTNGNITNTNNSYGQISDERLKTDIVDANSQWEDIKAVKVRNFKFGTAPEGHDFSQIGVISQEIEAAGMNGLIEESDPDDAQLKYNPDLLGEKVKTVKYSVLYMKAIKALQEAMDRIEVLETKVSELEG